MNIDSIAKFKKKDEFFNCFKEGDQYKIYYGRSLIFDSLSNKDLTSRYDISNFLIDKGVDVKCLNSEKESVLHVLLGQIKHDLKSTIELCKRFLNLGVDINILDKNREVAFLYIINMNLIDEELKPLYDLWFSQPYVELAIPNAWGFTPIDIARKMPYRKEILERMENYVQQSGKELNR